MPLAVSPTTAPTIEPLTLADIKAHLRVDLSDDDTLIEGLGVAARKHTENFLRRQLLTATWKYYLPNFPRSAIPLPLPPLQSVSSITYTDTDGDTETWSSDEYVVNTIDEPGTVELAYGEIYPTVRVQTNSICITFVAGYGDTAETVPEPIRHAMMLLVGHWYDNRNATTEMRLLPTPEAVDSLLWPYRVF